MKELFFIFNVTETLEYNDLKFKHPIYEAEACTIYKGKYKALSVAIKVYNLSRLSEENKVNLKK